MPPLRFKKIYYFLITLLLLIHVQKNSFAQDCILAVDSGYPIVISPICSSNTGVIEVQATGTGIVTYQLNDEDPSTNGHFDGLATGNYTIIIVDENNCQITLSITLEGNESVEISELDTTDSDCNESNGSVTIFANGDGLTYSLNNQDFQDSNQFFDLAGGTYTAYSKDVYSCIDEQQFTILQGSIEYIDAELTHTTCIDEDGRIIIEAYGNQLRFRIIDHTSWQSSNTFNNLSPGLYKVEIIDDDGCTLTKNYRIKAQLDYDLEVLNPSCNQTNGAILIDVFTNGTYEYSIDDGNTFQDHGEFLNLDPGEYFVVIRLKNTNCFIRKRVLIDPDTGIIIDDIIKEQPICENQNGNIFIYATGPGLTYTLTGSQGYSETNQTGAFPDLYADNYSIKIVTSEDCEIVIPANLPPYNDIQLHEIEATPTYCTETNGTVSIYAESELGHDLTFSFNGSEYSQTTFYDNLYPGVYELIIESSSGCRYVTNVQVPSYDPIIITSLPTTIPSSTCTEDGAIQIYAEGDGLEFSLDNETWQTDNLFTGLNPGVYIIYVRAANGCTYQTGDITLPTTFEIQNLEITDTFCERPEGEVVIDAIGSEITYSIDGSPFQDNPHFSGLAVGSHIITVKDIYGCIIEDSFEVQSLGGMTLEYELFYPSCEDNNAAIAVIPTTRSQNLTYNINGGEFQQDSIFYSLAIGDYKIVAQDEYGCTDSLFVAVTETSKVEHSAIIKDYVCFQHPGSISMSHVGGLQPFTYSLDSLSYQTSPEFTDLSEGMYTVHMLDRENCYSSYEIEVKYQCDALVPSAFTPDENGMNDQLRLLHERDLPILQFELYNTWGELVYKKNDFSIHDIELFWNGIDLQGERGDQKVFVYSVTYIDVDDSQKSLHGVTHLIR